MFLKNLAKKIIRKCAPKPILPLTVTTYPPGHFYSPLPDLEEFKDPRNASFDISLKELPGINLNEEGQLGTLAELKPYFRQFSEDFCESMKSGKTRFNFDQCYFKEADALTLHGLLSHMKPAQVIEVGSGHSSALMLDTADSIPDWQPKITFIEPYPEERLNFVLQESDRPRTRVIKDFVQRVPIEEFLALGQGDFLFIDSSHVSKIGSDVNFLFFEVLPRLKLGVIIHIHDIFWPFDYPQDWIMQGRAWNESYLLRALLTGSNMFEISIWNSWLGSSARQKLEEECPMYLRDTGGSIYLRKIR